MKKIYALLLVSLSFMASITLQAQVSGTVFRDFNGNGTKDNGASFNEPFVAGVTVKAFNAANVQLGTTKTTNASGAYSFPIGEIPATTAVRIEFSGLGTGDYSSTNGAGNGTSVQFVTAPNAATNFAINAPDDYWNNVAIPNPDYLVIAERRGLGSAAGYLATQATVIQANTTVTGPYNPANADVATTGTLTTVAQQQQTGSLFGLALQKKQQRYFAAAYLRRAVGVGPQGFGGVYMFEKPGASFSLTGSFTLQGVTPSNSAVPLDFGTVNRVTTPNTADNYMSNTNADRTRDIDAFAKAGTMSYGDIEADPTSDKIYMVNLFQKRLIVFDGSAATATLNGASAATLTPFTTAYDITSLPGVPAPTGAGNNLRPYAVKIYKGKGYLGVVSDAMATQDFADLRGYILQFDPANISAGFTTVLTITFTSYFGNYWKAWATTWAQAGGDATTSTPRDYPCPLIAGIEFNEDGSMDIGIKDRWGDQGGNFELNPVSGATGSVQCSINGDLLHACWTGAAWTLEGTGAGCPQPAGNVVGDNSNGWLGGYGPTGLEWYADRSGDGGSESAIGGLSKLMGSGRIISTVYDPLGQGEVTGSNYWSTMGIQYNNVTTGVKTQVVRVIPQSANALDKSNGMGDIEFLTQAQPIQIGNRIWRDVNGNGLQDAGETTAGVAAGTTVNLYTSTGVLVATTTTDANGNYYFSSLNVATDPRKPASWSGIGSVILPGFDYRIEVAVPSGSQLTRANVSLNSFDNIDNDATLSGANAVVTFNTGNTNHNFDIGFKVLSSIGDKVWRDDNTDGVQQASEPGVSGITVTLYQNGTDGLPGTADDVTVGSTVTDAYGLYLFDNLSASTTTATSYNVGFTLPSNYQFTTQTNTQVTGSSDATNTTTTSGGSTAANGSDANTSTGRTGSFWLAPGEAERGADAGLVFGTAAASNSIGDKVWYDNNSNGTQDAGEPGVAGVTVTLYASNGTTVVATTVTDANGNYLFTGLPAATDYIVGITPPAGMVFTSTAGTTPGNATTNSDVNATLGSATYGKTTVVNTGVAGTQVLGIDAGIIPQAATTASLGDKVWNDINSNGTQDAGEPGIAGVTVNLYEDANGDGVLTGGELVAVRTMVTDAFGNYIFNNLVVTGSNKWQVEFVQPVGYNNTPVVNNNSGNDETDSDITNNATDRTGFIRLKEDERNTKTDAGFVQAAPAGTLKLGDKVWRDDNGDGQQLATEPGVAGVTVMLYQNGTDGLPGTADDVLVATQPTDINGNYLFVNLAASAGAATNYNVQFSNIPSGFSFTTQNTGAAATDNNANSVGKTGSINLTADDLSIDAGIVQGVPSGLGSLGDKVWYDLNNDGVQNSGELGAAGVTVNLYKDVNNDGVISGGELTAVATTLTNALGEYMFGGLGSGNYQVGFTLPAALSTYTLSAKDAGSSDALDSDGNPKNTSVAGNTAGAQTSYTALVALASGEDKLTVDLGIVPPAATNTLGGTAWFDTDSDGTQTANPARIAGVMVTLYNSAGVAIATTTTDDNGDYLFTGLADGDYSVSFSNYPAGFDLTSKSSANDATGSDADVISGKTVLVTLNAGNRNDRSLDAGLVSTRAALGNKVWEDLNGDGIQDAGEPGIAGVTVTLWDDLTNQVAVCVTDENGYYFFPNLQSANWQVGFTTTPAGLSFTTKDNTGGADGDGANTWTGGGDSDVNPSGGFAGKTDIFALGAGQLNLTVDAGLRRIPIATVGNRVWDDVDGDGLQDAGEPGIAGVVATLYNSLNQPIGSAVTDGNGNWLITKVPVGTGYYVIFSNKPIGNFTIQDNGGAGTGGVTDSDTDSDVNSAGQTGTFDVAANTVNVKIDAGITSSIVLPVQLVSFTAQPKGTDVQLNWVVSEELNVSGYEVEFSTDGSRFTVIGTVVSSNSHNYGLLHTAAVKGMNYYRLKSVDKNGKVSYSGVRIVNLGKIAGVLVYPNPATDEVRVTFAAAMINKPVVMSVLSMDGKLVQVQRTAAASQTETLNVSRLSSGKYLLQILAGDEQINKTIEVIR